MAKNCGELLTPGQKKLEDETVRVGLFNLMPKTSKGDYRKRLEDLLGCADINFVLIDLEFTKGQDIATTLGSMALDGLIFTGANLELKNPNQAVKAGVLPEALPFSDIGYYEQYCKAVEWADNNIISSMYSCLSAQFALECLHNIHRNIAPEKIIDVNEFELISDGGIFLKGAEKRLWVPNASWGYIPKGYQAGASEIWRLTELAEGINSLQAFLALQRINNNEGLDVIVPTHPEYVPESFYGERERDGLTRYPNSINDPKTRKEIEELWTKFGQLLFTNWLMYIKSEKQRRQAQEQLIQLDITAGITPNTQNA